MTILKNWTRQEAEESFFCDTLARESHEARIKREQRELEELEVAFVDIPQSKS